MRDWICWQILWEVLHLASSYNSKGRRQSSTVYTLYDPTIKAFYQTFCDFTSENGFVWTLLEIKTISRLSPSSKVTQWTRTPSSGTSFFLSTYFRATCNFNTDGLVTTDYLRAKTTDLNILLLNIGLCVKMEYINIRGYDCYNCTAKMSQKEWHLHSTSHYEDPCPFTNARNSSVASIKTINPLHRCTSGDDATTQCWFREK